MIDLNKRPRRLHDGDTFTVRGIDFRVTFPYDDCGDAPWENSDGHGPVSGWERRSKRPGEWVLNSDRGAHRYYDAAEAMRLAKQDGWGLRETHIADLAKRLNRTPQPGDIRAEAVRRDFEFLRGWCNDEWAYVGVVVEILDEEGEPTGEDASLWGIESCADEYLVDVAYELAEPLAEAEADVRQHAALDAEHAAWVGVAMGHP